PAANDAPAHNAQCRARAGNQTSPTRPEFVFELRAWCLEFYVSLFNLTDKHTVNVWHHHGGLDFHRCLLRPDGGDWPGRDGPGQKSGGLFPGRTALWKIPSNVYGLQPGDRHRYRGRNHHHDLPRWRRRNLEPPDSALGDASLLAHRALVPS